MDRFAVVAALVAVGVGCGEPEAPSPEPPAEPPGETGGREGAADDGPPDDEERCEAIGSSAAEPLYAVAAENAECEYDTDCVPVSMDTACGRSCLRSMHPAGLPALMAARARANAACVAEFEAAGCDRGDVACGRVRSQCVDGQCRMSDRAGVPEVEIPESNRAGQDPPPPRPPPGPIEEERARRLLAAIVQDDPRLAQDFFFPLEAFHRVKAVPDPSGYWRRLFARYEQDIHALHRELGSVPSAELVALDIVPRGGWVRRGEEGNALPYWASRQSRLRYRVGDEERSFEVRVLITWGGRWYITHLSEPH